MSPSKKARDAEVQKVKGSKVKKLEGSKVQKSKAVKTSPIKAAMVKEQPANLQTSKPKNLPTSKPANGLGTNLLRVLAIAAVIGITVYVYSIRSHIEQFTKLGYLGIFLVALMANATVFLPAPGVAVVYAMGSIFNPIGVALAAGTGGAIGELSGYLAGFSGQAVIENTNIYNKISPWIEKYGGWTILALSAIPNPFFDIAGIAAGIAKMKPWRFLLFCWVGQIIKMTIFAFAGAYSIDWIASFYK